MRKLGSDIKLITNHSNILPGNDSITAAYLLKIGATLLQSQFVTKMKATDKPPQLNIKSYKEAPHISTLNRYLKGAKKKKKRTGEKHKNCQLPGRLGQNLGERN